MQGGSIDSVNECKISAKQFIGYEKDRPSYGPMRETLEACYELPPIGAIVEVYDVCWIGRTKYEESDQTPYRTFLQPHPDCVSARQEVKQFKVTGYTHGILNPLKQCNKMVLECVYPPECARVGIVTIPTLWISTGSTVAKVVERRSS